MLSLSFVTDVVAMAVSFVLAVLIGHFAIPVLQRLKASQTERNIMESHVKKNGTPTMGGVIFLGAMLLTCLACVHIQPHIIPVMILTIGFGIIGFIDDYLKVVLKRSDGLLAWQKMLLQIAVTTVYAVYIVRFSGISLAMRVPFTHGAMWDLGWLAIPVLYFAVIGTVNGTNFTDGLDGLATSVTVVVAAFFTVAAYVLGVRIDIVGFAMMGGLLGFLVYNRHPAKVFMGDTGSLALGGFVAGMAYMLQMPLFIIFVGIIYLVEVLSVILQVGSYKLRHGKRIFRMAPIHHHFELGGWSEVKIVVVFTAITAVVSIVMYFGI
ncbi:Phospho-N-acetylmuramoyl-pentapeptide-transferase [Lachnospiraceae bacterium XBD2001]|nr:Phospho-N-acetylmuramoyl-pentapeptide-transferase [Lachnospiraceae bacterium XBD2001]